MFVLNYYRTRTLISGVRIVRQHDVCQCSVTPIINGGGVMFKHNNSLHEGRRVRQNVQKPV